MGKWHSYWTILTFGSSYLDNEEAQLFGIPLLCVNVGLTALCNQTNKFKC